MIGQAISAKWWRLAPLASLVLLCAALGGVVASEWLRWQDATPQPAPAVANPTAPPAVSSFTMPALSTFGEVLSRPLFSATRRASDETSAATTAPSSMTLVAILISKRGPHALVRHGAPPQVTRVVEGDTIDGWTAETIKFDRVIFRRAGEMLELVPINPDQPHPAPTSAAPTPPIPTARPAPKQHTTG